MCLAQGYNTVTLVRLKPATSQSQVKHSTTEPLRSQLLLYISQTFAKLLHLTLRLLLKHASAHVVGCSRQLYAYAHVMNYILTVSFSSVDPDQNDPRGAV